MSCWSSVGPLLDTLFALTVARRDPSVLGGPRLLSMSPHMTIIARKHVANRSDNFVFNPTGQPLAAHDGGLRHGQTHFNAINVPGETGLPKSTFLRHPGIGNF
ncbi:uncharacterized protein LOC128208023 [Mya arenaria]|uniref:uncharacterized protein LOC128208023 n=1 Tax=Mya arenaria TaxID=6604 RepID=UPI0022DEF4CA|nr:uncharacterized protein LOC128208023 [Mya arenaria]